MDLIDQHGVLGGVRDRWILSCILDNAYSAALAPVRDFEKQIVVVITTASIVPPNQVLIQVVNIAAKVRERVPTKLELGDVCKYFRI